MKNKFTVYCPAKVNLSLDVVGRREDGYHNLEMIMHTVKLCDTLTITCESSTETHISVVCDSRDVPSDSHNLCAKAADAFLEAAVLHAKINIHIDKKIPVGAGLGGGSSDAAGTLNALNEMFDFPLKNAELADIAKNIGADVPFFIYGGCMLAEGIGEILSPLPPLKDVIFLIAKPDFGVSTPWVYKNLKLDGATPHPDTNTVIEAVRGNDIALLAQNAGNVLETVTLKKYPDIEQYKAIMQNHGAAYALMSGSGSSVFGVFTDAQKAKNAYSELKGFTNQVYIA